MLVRMRGIRIVQVLVVMFMRRASVTVVLSAVHVCVMCAGCMWS